MKELLPMVGELVVSKRHRKVHGRVLIPEGYCLAYVPSDAEILSCSSQTPSTDSPSHPSVSISCSYSMPKAVIAVVQTLYAAITLYNTKGNQIQVYGYAAFGLTVTPYIIMSIVNFVAQVATPDYPALFLVRSDVMNEAERRGGIFDGVVGRLAEDDLVHPDPRCHVGVFRMGNTSPQTYHITPYDSASGGSFSRNEDGSEGNQNQNRNAEALLAQLYRPKSGTPTGHANEIEEWIFIPSCNKFRRTRVILDDTTSAPEDSKKFLTRSEENDVADSGYRGDNKTKRGPWRWISFWASLALSYVSIFIIGYLSSFSDGKSTLAQRCWTMSWLAVGIGLSPLSPWFRYLFLDFLLNCVIEVHKTVRGNIWGRLMPAMYASIFVVLFVLAFGGIFFIPAFGGLVTVGQMLQEYGSCVSLN